MLGSQSVSGFILTQFMLRSFSFLSFIFLIIWILSPLGGQSSLRLLEVKSSPAFLSTYNLTYLRLGSQDSSYWGVDAWAWQGSDIQGLYAASLMAPEGLKDAAQDMWGNIKIPILEKLDNSTQDEDGWIPVPTDASDKNLSYAALLGIPASFSSTMQRSNTTTEFNLVTYYYYFVNPTVSKVLNWSVDDLGVNSSASGQNSSSVFGPSHSYTMFISGSGPWSGSLFPGIHNVTFVSVFAGNDSDYSTVAKMSMSQSAVSLQIRCQSTTCSATRIRKAQPSEFNPIDPFSAESFFQNFALFFQEAYPSKHPFAPSGTELFLANGTSFSPIASRMWDFSVTPPELFAERFGLAFNTFFLAGYGPTNFAGLNVTLDPDNLGFANYTTANIQIAIDKYVCSWTWLALLFFSSGILFVVSITGSILSRLTLGPEILGYVSTLTRDNPHIKLPPGGSTLDGPERSRLLKELWVRLEDSAEGQEVGHIALGSFEKGGAKNVVGRLRKGRLYN
jgi:hypothetical protein